MKGTIFCAIPGESHLRSAPCATVRPSPGRPIAKADMNHRDMGLASVITYLAPGLPIQRQHADAAAILASHRNRIVLATQLWPGFANAFSKLNGLRPRCRFIRQVTYTDGRNEARIDHEVKTRHGPGMCAIPVPLRAYWH